MPETPAGVRLLVGWPMTPFDLLAARARCEAAREEIFRLCKGTRNWTMCIPVQPDDSDIVFVNALDDTSAALSVIEAMAEALKTIQGIAEENHEGGDRTAVFQIKQYAEAASALVKR